MSESANQGRAERQPPRAPGRPPTTLAVRIALACLAVAVVAALTAALSSARLLVREERQAAREALAARADALAGALAARPDADPRRLAAGIADLLGDTTDATDPTGPTDPTATDEAGPTGPAGPVALVVVTADGAARGAADAVAAARRAGVGATSGTVSRTLRAERATVLVEGRAAGGGSIALVQSFQPAGERGARLWRPVAVASVIGFLGAAVAGSLLAAVVSRPLRRVAALARTMREGRRDVRVPVEGPREVAEVAASVNELAAALQHSEERQRRFLMAVSHELRTPLTAIRGFAESVADGVTEGDDARDAGRTMLAEAQRLDHLVADLLDLARLGADDFRLELTDVDLSALVADAVQVWRARARRAGVELRSDVAPGLAARTDPRRLRQVIDGLAENALRVTPAGRPLVVALAPLDGGSGAALEVRDGGPGLEPEDYPVAFERGVLRGRYEGRRPGGVGIGLSLVHGLVERLGGRIVARPAPEGGAAFRVELPG